MLLATDLGGLLSGAYLPRRLRGPQVEEARMVSILSLFLSLSPSSRVESDRIPRGEATRIVDDATSLDGKVERARERDRIGS